MTEVPLTIREAAGMLRGRQLSSVELTTGMLACADRLDARLGTYLVRFDEQALAAARAADAALAAGIDHGPLQGIPVAVKDILAASEGPTTAQSLVLDPAWGAGRDAPIVSRLRAAGAVITGKVTTMEFACGMPDPAKPFPIPRNPWDTGTWPGGSSSGTGSGIAAGMFLAGIGTDTGGSIRCPAAYCGVSGLKATFGRVPKSGCTPIGYSLDHVGPLARSAWDCAAMLRVLAGHHPSDPESAAVPVADYVRALGGDLRGVRVGVDRVHHFPDQADPALAGCFEAAVSALERLGASVVEVSLPYWDEMLVATMLTAYAEGLAYQMPDLRTRWEDFFAGTRLFAARGALVSGADYVQAQRVRRVAQRALQELYREVDLVVAPTAGTGALRYDDHDELASLDTLLETMFTGYWNATGSPALSVPMGFTAEGLPLSLQIAGRPFEESLVLNAGDAYQGVTDWHLRVPPLVSEAAAVAVRA
jgi:aspartyl-tRNA(Asn)/glutamyl-tRNA(Gln) amidotransferase subunit A